MPLAVGGASFRPLNSFTYRRLIGGHHQHGSTGDLYENEIILDVKVAKPARAGASRLAARQSLPTFGTRNDTQGRNLSALALPNQTCTPSMHGSVAYRHCVFQ